MPFLQSPRVSDLRQTHDQLFFSFTEDQKIATLEDVAQNVMAA